MYKMVWSFIALCGLSLHVAANEIELSISDEIIDLRFTANYEQDFRPFFSGTDSGQPKPGFENFYGKTLH